MTEEYLHFLWRMKRLNFNNLRIVNENKSLIQIKNIGWYNTDSGPDFFNGTVIINGIQWSGNIEIHIKSSDWYAHNHHLDEAYNNVILHVVYEYDKEVFINGNILPTIELKDQIDTEHLQHYNKMVLNTHQIPCNKSILNHKFSLMQQMDLSCLHRIEKKGLNLIEGPNGEIKNKNSVLLSSIFKSVGGKTNALPLQELSKLWSHQIIFREKWDSLRIEALLFGGSGLLNTNCSDEYHTKLSQHWAFLKNKYQLLEMNPISWKFGGMRSYSFPTYILAQLCALLQQFDFTKFSTMTPIQIMKQVNALDDTQINPYWKTHFLFGKKAKKKIKGFSPLFKSNLIINGIVPYFIALKHLESNFTYADKAFELLEILPPENNSIINYWKEVGIYPKNALESQGLIEIYNEFCTFRKCLSCKVGVSILGK